MGDDEWQSAPSGRRRQQQANRPNTNPPTRQTNPGQSSSSTGVQAPRQHQGPSYGQGASSSSSYGRGDRGRGGGFSGGSRGRGIPIRFQNMPLDFNKKYTTKPRDFEWKPLPDRETEIELPPRPSQPASICESYSKILANFFRTKIDLPPVIFHYQMFFSRFDGGDEFEVSQKMKDMDLEGYEEERKKTNIRFSPDIRTNLSNCLVRKIEAAYKERNNNMNKNDIAGIITDFSDALYSCVKLHTDFLDWTISGEELGPDSDSSVRYKVAIRLTKEDLHTGEISKDINDMKGKQVKQVLTDIERVYNVLVRCFNTDRYVPIGRSALVDFERDGGYPLTKGLVSYKGYNVIQCLSNGWKPYLNVDIANNACIPNTSLMNYLAGIFTNDRVRFTADQCGDIYNWSPQQFNDARTRLIGVRIVYYPEKGKALGGIVADLLETCVTSTKFNYDSGDGKTKEYSIKQYVQEKYTDSNGRKITLRYPKGPCLKLKGKKVRMIPGELCKIVKGQSFNQKLDEVQTSKMIDVSRKDPDKLLVDITKVHKDLNLGDNPLAKRYGVTVEDKMLKMDKARVLPAPQIVYGPKINAPNRNERAVATPVNGVWDGWSGDAQFEFFSPKQVQKWAILNVAGVDPREIQHFTQRLVAKAASRNLMLPRQNGLFFETTLKLNERELRKENEDKLVHALTDFKNKKVDFVLVIIPAKNGPVYFQVKQSAELQVGVLSQCVVRKNFQQSNRTESIIGNILIKLHSKLGGVNHVVQAPERYRKEFEVFTDQPVMILGADVTHPSPSVQGQKQQPSLAAVTASYARNGMPYMMSVEAQIKPNKDAAEVILNLQSIMEKFLKQYKKDNQDLLPVKIFYYRDGVGSGQFKEVLHKEMRAIRHACTQLQNDLKLNYEYRPRITFVTIQKRNKVRFFNDENGRIVNVNAGTIIDTEITHPTDHDFFLIPHQGILGTSRPTRCHVLWDDSSMSMDRLQMLTYYLCYMYVRCNRAVRIPAPTYYAHFAAARAKVFVEGQPPNVLASVDRLNEHLRKRDNFAALYPMHFI